MKMSGTVNYKVEDVFNVFIKNAKRDFKDFDEDDAKGCKVEKKIKAPNGQDIHCVVEISQYAKNEIYEITTTNQFSTCVSTYIFKSRVDGTTTLTLSETQASEKIFQWMSLWVQRLLARRNFKLAFNNIIDTLNNEVRVYTDNKERCKPKSKNA